MCGKNCFILFIVLFTPAHSYDPDFEVPDEYIPNWEKYMDFLTVMDTEVKKFETKKYKKENMIAGDDPITATQPETATDEVAVPDTAEPVVITTTAVDNNSEDGTVMTVTSTGEGSGAGTPVTTAVGDESSVVKDDGSGDKNSICFYGPVKGKGTVSIAANFGSGTSNLTPNSPYGPTFISSAFYQPCLPLPCPYPYYPFDQNEENSSNSN